MKSINLKKILIALDYSQTAQKVAEVGFLLAKALGAETVLCHVITDPVYYSTPGYSPIMGFNGFEATIPVSINNADDLKAASINYLNKVKLHLGEDTIQTIVKEGDIADAILKTAKSLNIDIIVMGSHSRKWLEDILMGSITEKVLHNSPIPLFIIPTKKRN